MTFEEIKDYLNQNILVIKNLTPSFSETESVISLILKKVEYAIQHEDVEEITSKEFRLINQFFSHYIKGLILLDFKFTEEIAEVSKELSLLIDNFSNIYIEKDSFDPTGLIIRTLVQVNGKPRVREERIDVRDIALDCLLSGAGSRNIQPHQLD